MQTGGSCERDVVRASGDRGEKSKFFLKGARDSTKYGSSRTSTKNFYVHHTERISLAAQQYDARAIRKKLNGLKHEFILGSGAAGGVP